MPPKHELSIDLRSRIIIDYKNGLSQRKIAEKFSVSKTAVQKICFKYKSTGSVQNLPRKGRPKATSSREDALILREIKKQPTNSARKVKETLNLEVSCKTIQRRLKSSGFLSCIQKRKPLISKVNRSKRLVFAKTHIDKGPDFWNKVLWSDESKFELFGSKKRQHVWRKPNEDLKERHLKKNVKHGGGSIMVWGSFAATGVEELFLINGIMEEEDYVKILETNLMKSARKIGLGRRFTFQQDNDPKHTSKVAKNYFKKAKVKLLEWPPQSPDLNPIENLWSILDEKVKLDNRKNKNELFQQLTDAWINIPAETTQKLVESMPRRLRAVLDAKGGATKY